MDQDCGNTSGLFFAQTLEEDLTEDCSVLLLSVL